jgi:FkbM family methyltransferase
MSEVYVFGNGIRLRRGDVMDMQVERYSEPGNPNLHEPVEEEWMLRSFAEALPEAPLFLDIGAGVGYYSFLIKKRWPDAVVVAFEALARHADALEANRELNGLSPQDIAVVRAAVGQTSGEASFVDQGYGSMLAGGGTNRASVSVEMRSLTAVLQTLPPVHLMKMDIQGAELDVLKPASELLGRGGVRHMIIGTHGRSLHRGVVKLLDKLGYEIVLDDPSPPMQPDGLVVASFPTGPKAVRESWIGSKAAAIRRALKPASQ